MDNCKIKQNESFAERFSLNEKKNEEEYFSKNPYSVNILFKKELEALGVELSYLNQVVSLMPKHKAILFPLALEYYKKARALEQFREMNFYLNLFCYKGCEDVIPMLLEDFSSTKVHDATKWAIADCLYRLKSKDYADEYIRIASNALYGANRQMIILLIGKLKIENAIPLLISLLEDETVRLHAICALGDYKRKEFAPYFERFIDDKHSGVRKYAKAALKKIK